jgi:hypothetical protein
MIALLTLPSGCTPAKQAHGFESMGREVRRCYVFCCNLALPDADPLAPLPLPLQHNGKLDKAMSGRTFEVFARIIRGLSGAKLTRPGNFENAAKEGSAVRCTYKVGAGGQAGCHAGQQEWQALLPCGGRWTLPVSPLKCQHHAV